MTTKTEDFATVVQHLADELIDPERSDEDVMTLIAILMRLGPEVENFRLQGYQTLKTSLEEAEGLNDDLREQISGVVYGYAEGVRSSALKVLARACQTTPADEELISACFDTLIIVTFDSPLAEQGLDDEDLKTFRGLSTALAKYEDYDLLLDRYEYAEIKSQTSLDFYFEEEEEPVAAEAPVAEPATKSLLKGLFSSLRKAG